MEDDWRVNEAAMNIVDAILLGLIRAHPGTDSDDTRLRAAKNALFAIQPPRGRPIDSDVPELWFMAQEYLRERGEPTWGEGYVPRWPNDEGKAHRSNTELARQALDKRRAIDPHVRIQSDPSKIRNLERKFSANQDTLLRLVAGWGSDTFDEVADSSLGDVKRLMSVLGIPIALANRPSRDTKAGN